MTTTLLICLVSMVVPGLDSVFCECLITFLGYCFNRLAGTGSLGCPEGCALGRGAILERTEGELCAGYRCSCSPQFPVCLQRRKHWHREETPELPEPRAGGHSKPARGLPHVRRAGGELVGWVCLGLTTWQLAGKTPSKDTAWQGAVHTCSKRIGEPGNLNVHGNYFCTWEPSIFLHLFGLVPEMA